MYVSCSKDAEGVSTNLHVYGATENGDLQTVYRGHLESSLLANGPGIATPTPGVPFPWSGWSGELQRPPTDRPTDESMLIDLK